MMEIDYSLLPNRIEHPLLLDPDLEEEAGELPQKELLDPKQFRKQSKSNISSKGGLFGRKSKTLEDLKKSNPIEIKGSSPIHNYKNKEENNPPSSGGGSKMSFLKVLTRRNSSTQGKHKKMKWKESSDVLDGVTFCVKFLGSTLIDAGKTGASDAAEATKTVMQMVKMGQKPARIGLSVSTNGITLSDPSSGEIREEISIYDIAHCSTDANYSTVFHFIATNKNDLNECYCFATNKRKMAQHITLTIAQAFKVAYEIWQNENNTMSSKDMSGVSIPNDMDIVVGSSDSARTNSSTGSSDIRDWVAFDQDQNDQEELANRIDLVTLSPFHNKQEGGRKRRERKGSAADDLLIFLN